ncbi:MAG: hypothetical protein MSS40_00615 [Bacteroidales bacterium]|nr:hypothetical protein [Bacteroidales bacterium]
MHDNNLRYYRTSFVGRNRSMKNMRQLMNLSTDMLCIKQYTMPTVAYFQRKKINSLPPTIQKTDTQENMQSGMLNFGKEEELQ